MVDALAHLPKDVVLRVLAQWKERGSGVFILTLCM